MMVPNFLPTPPPNDPNLIEKFLNIILLLIAPEEETVSPLLGLFLNWLPMLLFIGIWIFL